MSWLLGALFFGAMYVLSGLRICREYERLVVFRLGRLAGVRGPGLIWIAPIFESGTKLDLRVRTIDVEPQETITKDSVTIRVNAVLFYRVANPELAVTKVVDYRMACYQVALTSLRNIIGQHVLDEVLKERDAINDRLQELVDVATDPWGIQVEAVEMKDVEIPSGMQRAMAKEAEAVREKRARLIKAEAEQEAAAKLSDASRQISENPAALELRRMQMISEVGAEQNTTTIIMLPSDFVTMAKGIGDALTQKVRLTGDESSADGVRVDAG